MSHNSKKIRVCIFACSYANASVANYTYGLLSSLRDNPNLEIKLVSSHCSCLWRFDKQRYVQTEKCPIIKCPYLRFPRKKSKLAYLILNLIPARLIDAIRGFVYLRATKDNDIIHFQQSGASAFGTVPLIPLILFCRQKKIVTFHSTDLIPKLKLFYRLYNRVDKIIVHSVSMEDFLLKMGIEKSKIVRIPHGVNIPLLYGFERSKITFMGAPEKRKGIFTILDAVKLLKNKGIPIKISLFGFYGDSEKRATEVEAAARGVAESLVWGGRLTETEFDQELQKSLFTFAVYFSSTSGSSVVTRAMANATPVLASDVGGLKEYLGGGGVLIPPGKPNLIAVNIEMMIKNRQMLEDMGAIGRKRASQYFSWQEIARQTSQIYSDVL